MIREIVFWLITIPSLAALGALALYMIVNVFRDLR